MSLFRRRKPEPPPEPPKPPRKSRAIRVRILGPILSVLGLGVGYMLLDRTVPLIRGETGSAYARPTQAQFEGGGMRMTRARAPERATSAADQLKELVWSLSDKVKAHPKESMILIGACGVFAIVLAALSRLTAYLLYFAGMLLLLADVGILVVTLASRYRDALDGAL